MSPVDRFRIVWTPYLRRRQGRYLQAVGLACPVGLGAGGTLTLQVGSRRYQGTPVDLLHGPGKEPVYFFLVPRPAGPVTVKAAWKPPRGPTHRDTLKLAVARPMKVYVTFKTHLDLGYTHPFDEVVRLYQLQHLPRLLDLLEATAARPEGKRFVWTLSTWLLEQLLDPKAVDRSHRRRLESFLRAGQVTWTLNPFTTHSEFFGIEELTRSLLPARALAERFDRPVPTAAKMTDVPAHTAALAMALANAGGTFLQIGTNPEFRGPRVPNLFRWSLPDQTSLLCHYSPTYGTGLLPPADWPWDHWLSVQMTSDNVGPPALDTLGEIDWIDRHFDYPVCRTGSMDSFAEAILADHADDLPEVEGECVDNWIPGLASQARATAVARRTKETVPAAEILTSLATWSAGRPTPRPQRECIDAGYRQLTLYTEHTWGDHALDTDLPVPEDQRYTSPALYRDHPASPVDRWVASWKNKAGFAETAAVRADEATAQAWHTLTRGKRVRGKRAAKGPFIVLFNPLSLGRGGLVKLADHSLPAGPFELIDPRTQQAITYHRHNGGIEFIAPHVPGLGTLALEVQPVRKRRPGEPMAEWYAPRNTLHTHNATFQFHQAGGLARWYDRLHSCQWCSTESEHPLGTYLYEMPGDKQIHAFAAGVHSNALENTIATCHRRSYTGHTRLSPVPGGPATIQPEINDLFARVVVQGKCPKMAAKHSRPGQARRYRTTFTVYHGRPELHVNISLFDKPPTYAAEAGYALFALNADEPCILADRIGQVVVPTEELAPGNNAAHFAIHHGLRVENRLTGMNLFSLDTPLIGLGRPGAYRYDENARYANGDVYATLFANTWGTNFALWQAGDFSFDFILAPTGNDDWDGQLSAAGAQWHRPLMATVRPNRPGITLGETAMTIEPADIQLVTIKPMFEGTGYVLRLWNSAVEEVSARLHLPLAPPGTRLWRADGLERPVERLRLGRDRRADVPLPPQHVATLLVQTN